MSMQESFRVSEGDEEIQWGELHVTSARLIFVPRGGEMLSNPTELCLFLPSISRIDQLPSQEDVQLQILTKDGRRLLIWFDGTYAHREGA